MPSMRYDELQPGDILFEKSNTGDFTHALIWVGPQGHNMLVVAHAIYDDTSSTRSANRNVVGLSRLPEKEYVVFRMANRELAQAAAEQAKKWAKFEVPYDTVRSHQIFGRKDFANTFSLSSSHGTDSGAFTYHWAAGSFINDANREEWEQGRHLDGVVPNELSRTEVQESGSLEQLPNNDGIYRMIKYAARSETCLTFPKEGPEDQRGFNCSFFVTLCYQTAAVKDIVKPVDVKAKEWPSEKKTQDPSTIKRPEIAYKPALFFWNNEKEIDSYKFGEKIPTSFMLDAKKVDCNGLVKKLRATPSECAESSLSVTDIPKLKPTDKSTYVTAKQEIADDAKALKTGVSESFKK